MRREPLSLPSRTCEASSLDFVLRAWTDDEYEPRTSELALAVHRSLCEAGILHLASESPAARAALSGADRKV